MPITSLTIAILLFQSQAFAYNKCEKWLSDSKRHIVNPVYILTESNKRAKYRDSLTIAEFKNHPLVERAPRKVDLTGFGDLTWKDKVSLEKQILKESGSPDLARISPEWKLWDLANHNSIVEAEEHRRLNSYRARVALLRKGDTVLFGETIKYFRLGDPWDKSLIEIAVRNGAKIEKISATRVAVVYPQKSFVLGDFLGAGNTVHTFSILDQPDKAIRISFRPRNAKNTVSVTREHGTSKYASTPPQYPGLRTVKIFDARDEYAIAERVWGTVANESFVHELKIEYGAGYWVKSDGELRNNMPYDKLMEKLDEDGTHEEVEMFQKLLNVMTKVETLDTTTMLPIKEHFKQFIFDEKMRDWVLVDWE